MPWSLRLCCGHSATEQCECSPLVHAIADHSNLVAPSPAHSFRILLKICFSEHASKSLALGARGCMDWSMIWAVRFDLHVAALNQHIHARDL